MMHRILEENGFATNKSIKKVFPKQENIILILDDQFEILKESKESGDNFISIYPYNFFKEIPRPYRWLPANPSVRQLTFRPNLLPYKFINQLGPPNGEKTKKEKYLKYEYGNVLFCITN